MHSIWHVPFTCNNVSVTYCRVVEMWLLGSPIVLVFGTTGNVFLLIVMSGIRSHMTSYFFIKALSASDLVVLIFSLLPTWIEVMKQITLEDMHPLTCKFYQWVNDSVSLLSTFFIVAVTIRRTSAVVFPHYTCARSKRLARIIVILLIIAACSVNAALPFVKVYNYKDSTCDYIQGFDGSHGPFITVLNCTLFSFLPSLLLIVSDGMLIRAMAKSAQKVKSPASLRQGFKRHGRVSMVVITKSIVFFILTFPASLMRMVELYGYDLDENEAFQSSISIFHFLWYVSGSANVIIYTITGAEVRQRAKKMCFKFAGITQNETSVEFTESESPQPQVLLSLSRFHSLDSEAFDTSVAGILLTPNRIREKRSVHFRTVGGPDDYDTGISLSWSHSADPPRFDIVTISSETPSCEPVNGTHLSVLSEASSGNDVEVDPPLEYAVTKENFIQQSIDTDVCRASADKATERPLISQHESETERSVTFLDPMSFITSLLGRTSDTSSHSESSVSARLSLFSTQRPSKSNRQSLV